jgi:hypothetical protein
MEPLSAFAARKADPTDKIRRLPVERIFEISSYLSRLVIDDEGRKLLHRRLRSYAYTHRRGRLRLPSYFPAEVRALSNLTKREVREMLYWVKPSTSLIMPLSKWQYEFVTHHYGGPIWNRLSQRDSHMAHVDGLPRLRKTDAPSCGWNLWPSSPSFSEMLEMCRRGVSLLSVHASPGITVKDCITRKDLSNNIRLARKIVAKNIVGIRSSVEIPEAWLPWFRYRQGFSILSVRWTLPSGLVRFLLAQWKIRHTNLWLVEHCSLKIFLRKHTAVEYGITTLDTVEPADTESVYSGSSGLSRPSTYPFPLITEDEFAAEFGEEFLEFFRRLPDS